MLLTALNTPLDFVRTYVLRFYWPIFDSLFLSRYNYGTGEVGTSHRLSICFLYFCCISPNSRWASTRKVTNPTYCNVSSLPVATKCLISSPLFSPYEFVSRYKFSNLATRQLLVEFYLLTFSRLPLRKKQHNSGFHKKRTHDFRTSRCTWLPTRPLGRRGYLIV